MKFTAFFRNAGIALLAGTASMVIAGSQASAEWPEKPIELVCATSPKSGAAHWCRVMANTLANELDTRVEPLFEGGGGGNTAAEMVANKPADGYTWLHRNTSYAGYMNMPTFKVDPDQFEVIVEMTKFLYVIGVPTESKYKTFQDLVDDMKANPGKISIAANKPGSVHHVHLINLFRAFDVQWNFVPYKGSGGAMRDVLGGHVPVGIMPTGIWMPQVKAGKGRTLLLINEEPYPGIDAPLPKDFGQDYPIEHQVQGFFLKKGTPDDVKKKIVAALGKVAESKEYKDYIDNTMGAFNVFNTDSEKLTARFHKLRKETGEFLKNAGLLN